MPYHYSSRCVIHASYTTFPKRLLDLHISSWQVNRDYIRTTLLPSSRHQMTPYCHTTPAHWVCFPRFPHYIPPWSALKPANNIYILTCRIPFSSLCYSRILHDSDTKCLSTEFGVFCGKFMPSQHRPFIFLRIYRLFLSKAGVGTRET